MNIGEAARRSGISSKVIRHHAQLGLIAPSGRSEAGYRVFSERDLGLLRFIRQARSLGFSLEQIGQLVLLWQDEARASLDVKRVAERHLADLDAKIRALQTMRDTLTHLVGHCPASDDPDCPILKRLAAGEDDAG